MGTTTATIHWPQVTADIRMGFYSGKIWVCFSTEAWAPNPKHPTDLSVNHGWGMSWSPRKELSQSDHYTASLQSLGHLT